MNEIMETGILKEEDFDKEVIYENKNYHFSELEQLFEIEYDKQIEKTKKNLGKLMDTFKPISEENFKEVVIKKTGCTLEEAQEEYNAIAD